MNHLYYGDNLEVLREHIPSDSVDLIYLDPPFNSKATYNILFKSPAGQESTAQVEAFKDSWHWGEESELCFDQVIESGRTNAVDMLRAFRSFLGENDMMAYLTMMAIRLIELHRVLKPTGSLYLHCDSTASHYIKILLDSIFHPTQFLNEIIWHYQTGGAGKRQYARKHDTILFYSKTRDYKFFPERIRIPRSEKALKRAQNPKGARIKASDTTKLPDDVFEIQALNPMGKERLGYPTQKPLALLERIILASSNPDDTILDPFCGCGTTVHAAQKLKRSWVGIDITHLAISLIEKRLNDAFPEIDYTVHGTPKDLAGAEALAQLDKYQFQWWALSLIQAQPYRGKQKGSDRGIDGIIYFRTDKNKGAEVAKA